MKFIKLMSICLFVIVVSCGNPNMISISIKGLYLGMSNNQLWNVISKDWKNESNVGVLDSPEKIEREIKSDGKYTILVARDNSYNSLKVTLHDSKVISIEFEREFIRNLLGLDWKSHNEELVATLGNVYKIIIIKQYIEGARRAGDIDYLYISPKNDWKLEINGHGNLSLRLISGEGR